MSQNEEEFQPKTKKFGSGKGRGFGGEKRGFGKKFEGDRGAPRGEGRSDRPRRDGDKPFGARRSFGDGENRKPRFDRNSESRGDRGGERRTFKPRFDRGGEDRGDRGGDRPYKPRFNRDAEGGGERRSFKPRFDRNSEGRGDRSGGGDGERRQFKPRFDRGGEGRGDRGGDRPYKPRFNRDGEGGGERRSFKPRFDREERGGEGRGERSESRRESRPETRGKLKSDRPSYGSPSSAYLFGVHSVTAALSNPKRLVQRLLATAEGFETIREAYDEAIAAGLTRPEAIIVEREDIDRLLPRDAVHQGILLDVQPLEDVFLIDIVNAFPDDATVLVLDQVTDPHNVGAILRSAAAMGAAAVVMQKLHAPDVTGTLAKSASGAAEVVSIVREVNLTRALEQLKEAGFLCIGLDEDGDQELAAALPKGGKVALVLGAEGDGIRRLVSETCDTLVRLPTQGPIASLNVSNAAAIALYERARAKA